MISTKFLSPSKRKLIYVFRINDNLHKGCLKIGDATVLDDIATDLLSPNCKELQLSARNRIDDYTCTAGITYELLYTELAINCINGEMRAFRDHDVHRVLKNCGFQSVKFDTNKSQNEWFKVDLQTVIKSIDAVKHGRSSLNRSDISTNQSPVVFRPEQLEAINKTIKRYKVSKRMLWNAKMRFGKTLTALQVAKLMNFKKIIIVTHRPVVSDGWFSDFKKIFYDREDFLFGSKILGATIQELLKRDSPFVYFASIQDLRGSKEIGGDFDKNTEILNALWDFVVVDEAHEGTQTQKGKSVLEQLVKENESKTYILELSGTPFNILTNFEQESIYTWDYIMEQEAKATWNQTHFGDSNPYEELPRMNIFTYHLEDTLPVYLEVEDKAFNFREFFKLWTGDKKWDGNDLPQKAHVGEFVHEEDVIAFLDLICREDTNTNYPFSNLKYRSYFRHSLWMVPGVKEAKALSLLLQKHPIFSNFNIVNVAGPGDEEIVFRNALQEVKNAITGNSSETYTITISCGRLTTGVSIPEWTAVMMLSGTYSTAASQYLQTIFRVQTPSNIDGQIKEECYVFDFAPDRTLKMVAEAVQLSARAGSKNPIAELSLQKFLNYCPIISISDSKMKVFTVSELLGELKKAYAERVVKNGFDDPKMYNDSLLNLSKFELNDFVNLREIIGDSKQTKKAARIIINHEGFDEEKTDEEKKLNKKKANKNLCEEETLRLHELVEKRKNRNAAISILRAISIRLPLLIYGMDLNINCSITIENFPDYIDPLSWIEFMPKGVTKEVFANIIKYYDKDIFIKASQRIRNISKQSDNLEPLKRIQVIASLFGTFKNPDKETILTPWRVINMHLNNTIGGYSFFDETFDNLLEEPRFVKIEDVTDKVFFDGSKILDVNSKTGLYSLYVAYTLYKNKIDKIGKALNLDEKLIIWDEVITKEVFVLCKTTMAKHIAKRTLVGYRNMNVNTRYFEDLINQLTQDSKRKTFINKMKSGKSYWKIEGDDNMKFNAIIGNPPYQIMDGGAGASAKPVYHLFVKVCKDLKPDFISLIMPSRWMTGGKGLDDFRMEMINDTHMRILHDHYDGKDFFTNVDIKGGICYFLWDLKYNSTCDVFTITDGKMTESKRFLSEEGDNIFIRDSSLIKIKDKVQALNEKSFENLVSSRRPYGLSGDLFKDPSKYGLAELSNTKIEFGYTIIGLDERLKRVERYCDYSYKVPKLDMADKFKIFIPRNYGNGLMGEKPSSPILAEPGMICTETFLQIGPFNDKSEMKNCLTYMKTKLFRLLVGIRKNDQGATKSIYKLVPLVEFSKPWTDDELFVKYHFSNEEVAYINEIITD